jgi:short-subunit dehydrogenase
MRGAAARGAKLVLAARNEDALARLADELNNQGTETIYVVADVGHKEQVRHIGEAAIRHFGRLDTWINNAGVGIFGTHEEVSTEDKRQVFETNFWGVVYGSLAAVKHLRSHGGALINVGSGFSDRAAPLQGIYAASKHAVKGFTDSLRIELEEENLPISVTLIKPASIDTQGDCMRMRLFIEVNRDCRSPCVAFWAYRRVGCAQLSPSIRPSAYSGRTAISCVSPSLISCGSSCDCPGQYRCRY